MQVIDEAALSATLVLPVYFLIMHETASLKPHLYWLCNLFGFGIACMMNFFKTPYFMMSVTFPNALARCKKF